MYAHLYTVRVSIATLDRMWGSDIMYGELTFPCLEGGMEWGTATGLAACGVDWNGDNKYTQSHIF